MFLNGGGGGGGGRGGGGGAGPCKRGGGILSRRSKKRLPCLLPVDKLGGWNTSASATFINFQSNPISIPVLAGFSSVLLCLLRHSICIQSPVYLKRFISAALVADKVLLLLLLLLLLFLHCHAYITGSTQRQNLNVT